MIQIARSNSLSFVFSKCVLPYPFLYISIGCGKFKKIGYWPLLLVFSNFFLFNPLPQRCSKATFRKSLSALVDIC